MSDKKYLTQICRKKFLQKRHVALFSAFLILGGIMLGWISDSSALDVPRWVTMGPTISIASDIPWLNIFVKCEVEKGGVFTLDLQSKQNLKEPAQVWILVSDFSYPFRWKVDGGEVTYRTLTPQNPDENTELDDYPDNRKYVSEARGSTIGESIDLLDIGWHAALFSAIIEPGEEGRCELQFQMDPDYTEYRYRGNIVVRMPIILNDSDAPIYQTSLEDMKKRFDVGDYNLLPLFSNFMIDGIPIFETRPVISVDYYSEYMINPDFVVRNIYPTPSRVIPAISWQESIRYIPYLSFQDLSYDKYQLAYSCLSGILISFGSGLLVLPISDWLLHEETIDDNRKNSRRNDKCV